jgi:ribulose bisphosphate carboxylase small subunit
MNMAGVKASALMVYPKEITDAYWQKKKGVIGKTKKTGLGAELKKCQALHKKVECEKLDVMSYNPKSRDDIEKAVKEAKVHYAKAVDPLRKQLLAAKSTAENAEKILKKAVGGGSAAKEAAAVAKGLGNFALTCKSVDLEATIKEAEAKVNKLNALAAKFLNDSIKKFLVGAKTFMSGDGSAESWNSLMKQNGRSVSNSIKQLDAYKKQFWKDFVKFQGFDLNTMKLDGDDDKTKKTRLKLAKAATAQVVAMAKFKP